MVSKVSSSMSGQTHLTRGILFIKPIETCKKIKNK